jgi:hypothetical protein
MSTYAQVVVTLTVLFGAVFVLNLLPAFAPPTWMVLSWIGFRQPDLNPVLIALVAALAATGGRVALAKCSHWLIHGRLMRDIDRENIAVATSWLERKKAMTATVFLLYAFSPLPSNYLFIAYGLTGLGLRTIALAFFFGPYNELPRMDKPGAVRVSQTGRGNRPAGRLSGRLLCRVATRSARPGLLSVAIGLAGVTGRPQNQTAQAGAAV